MAAGDYTGLVLMNMARDAANPQTDGFSKAKDALRVRPQITPADLQFCLAFGISPFNYLLAIEDSDKIAAERQGRADSDHARAAHRRRMDGFSPI